ncbi:restriction endonuclease subunit S [Acinetobacter seifertii]|uniref:restriction endonuclease subunit S n=1 Tax=Acinetobacter seifertii TaxID=1530123 RepID=UPI003F7164FD
MISLGRGDVWLSQIKPCLHQNHVFAVRPQQDRLNSFYLAALAASYYGKKYFLSCAKRSTNLASINSSQIKEFPVLVPPILEQKKIIQILSTWDQAISATEKLLENSQQQKKALMQQLLMGKKRLLDKNGVRFGGEWKIFCLADIADMNSGGTPKSSVPEYYDGDIPWVSIADMTNHGKWISTTERNLSLLGLENSSARIYPKNTILYAMYASIGECSIAKVEVSSSQAILGIRPKDCLHYEFLYFYLCSLKDRIKLQGQQGTQSNLNAGMVKDFKIYLPNFEEQKAISNVLNICDEEILVLQKKLDCLKREKKALMQQLLTGKKRVKVAA